MIWKSKKRASQDIEVEEIIPVRPQPSHSAETKTTIVQTLGSSISKNISTRSTGRDQGIKVFGQQGLKLKAQMAFNEPVELTGLIEGSLYSSSTVIVRKGAHITAELDVETLVVHGEIDSKQINVRNQTQIKSDGSIAGPLQTKSLEVTGGKLNGSCKTLLSV